MLADLHDLSAELLQRRKCAAAWVQRQAREREHFARRTLQQLHVRCGRELVPETDEDTRSAATRAPQQHLRDQPEEVVETRLGARKAGSVVYGGIAALDHRRDAGAQDVREAV